MKLPQSRRGKVLFPLKRLMASVAVASGTAFAAADLPTGESIQHGSADIIRDSNTLTVDQHTGHLIVNWDDFSVGAGNTVIFDQSVTDIALNRVVGDNPSYIFGDIRAGGQVFLVNQSGVLFSPTSRVDAAGLVASTLDIADDDFLAGNYNFEGNGGSVINQGEISVVDGGYVALLGQEAINEGIITARLGTVALGAGDRISVDMNGDGLVQLQVDKGTLDSLVANRGVIIADGGLVYMTAQAAGELAATVVNNDGIIEANSVEERDGRVFLTSNGDIENSGSISVAGANGDDAGQVRLQSSEGTTLNSGIIDASSQGGVGGSVQVLGEYVGLTGDSLIDVSGSFGGGQALIGGDYRGGNADIQNATGTFVGADAEIFADATWLGDGGEVIVWADDVTNFYGSIFARGGGEGGNGGFAEVSGKQNLGLFSTNFDLTAENGETGLLLLDPEFLTIINSTAVDDLSDELPTVSFAVTDINNTVGVDALNLVATGSSIQLNAGEIEFQNTNNIALTNNTSISFVADAAGAPGFTTADGSITVNNGNNAISITTTGTGTVSFDASGLIDLSDMTVNSASSATLVSGGSVTLGDFSVASLNITAEGGVSQNSGQVLNVSGLTTVTADTNAIALNLSEANDFGSITLTEANGGSFSSALVADSNDLTISTVDADSFTARADGNITVTGNITTAGDLILNADRDQNLDGAIFVNGPALSSNGGDVVLGGGLTPTSEYAYGNATYTRGVFLGGGTSVSSAGGDVVIRGQSANTGGGVLAFGSSINAGINSGTGSITIDGISRGAGADNAQGVELGGPLTSANTTASAISVTGSVTPSGALSGTSMGVNIGGAGAINATGGGGVVVSGTAAATTNPAFDDGVYIQSGGDITTTTGDISITGVSASGSGVAINGGTTIGGASASGDITVLADTLTLTGTDFFQSSGSLTIAPESDTGTIGVGGGAGTLQLVDAYFTTNFVDGFSSINIGNTNTGANGVLVSDGIINVDAFTFNDAINYRTQTSVNFIGALSVAEDISATVGDSVVINSTLTTSTGNVNFQASNTVRGTGAITGTGDIAVAGDADLSGVGGVGSDGTGTVDFSAGLSLSGANITIGSGSALALGSVTATGTLDATANAGGITDTAVVSAGGNATFTDTADAGITLGTLQADANVILDGGNTSITNDTALNLQGTINGTLSATATTGGITDSGALSVTGDAGFSDVNADGITLDTLQADANVIVSGGDTAITNDTALNLQGAVVGTLAATATTGGIADSGNLSVTGNATFTDTADAGITLGTLQADANVILDGGDTSITNDTALNLQGTVVGTLAATATTGGITDSDTLSVSGNATFTDTADAGITLGTLQADANVILDGGDTSITNDTALNLQGTVAGTLAATATTGGITDSDTLSVSGNATFTDTADAGITLGTLQADANVILDGGDTSITNDTALNLQGTVAGTLAATATTGGITDSDTLSVSGNATFTDTADAGITLGTLQADANVILDGGNTSITNDTALNLQGTINGTLSATATTGGITDSGALSVTGDAGFSDVNADGITLDTLQADANVIVSGGDTAITNDTALNLQGAVVGTLAATATTGGIADSGNLSVTGNATFTDTADAGITLGTLQADANVILDGGDTSITNDTALNLQGTVVGTLAATATTGGITDSDTLSVSGNATFTDTADAGITLGTLQADANVILDGGDTSITNDTALNLQGTVAGTLAATATTGGITDSDTLSVSGNATFTDTADAGITLGTLQADANVILDGGDTSITNDTALNLQGTVAGTLAATATTGGITDSAPLSVSGAASFTASAVDQTIVLDEATNSFGSVAVNTNGINGDVTLSGGALTFDASTVNGALAVTANGDIDQAGVVNVANGTTITSNVAGMNVDLSTQNNDFNAMTFVDGTGTFDSVAIRDVDSLVMGGGSFGTLSLTTGNFINQTGAIEVTGTTTITSTTGAGSVFFGGFANEFNDVVFGGLPNFVSMQIRDDDLNADGLDLSGTVQNLSVTAAGDITQSGDLTATGTTTITSNAAGLNVDLSTASNDFDTITFVNGTGTFDAVALQDDDAIAFGSGAMASLTLTSSGNVTQTGALNVSGTTTITADTGTIDVLLNNGTNEFNTVSLVDGTGDFGTVTVDDNDLALDDLAIGGDATSLTALTGGELDFTGGTYTTLNGNAEDGFIQSNEIDVSGTLTLTANVNPMTAVLNDADNEIATLSLATTGGSFTSIDVVDADTANDDFTFTAGGATITTVDIDTAGALLFNGNGTYGTLNADVGGNITQAAGAVDVSGVATFTANAADVDITLTAGVNDFATVALVDGAGGNFATVTINDGDAATDNLTIGGDATTLDVTTAGALTFNDGAYTTLDATAAGNIGQTAATALTVSGTTTLASTTGAPGIDVTLSEANEFATLALDTAGGAFGTVTINDADTATDDLTIGGDATTLDVTTAGALTFNDGTYGSLTASSGAGIDQTAATTLTVTVSADFDAATGIVLADLEAVDIAADTTTGAIDITNDAAAATTVTSLTTTGSDITFVQTGAGVPTFTTVSTDGAGTISLTADAGLAIDGAVSTAGGEVTIDADADLATTGTGLFTLAATGSIDTAGGNLTITAADFDFLADPLTGPIAIGVGVLDLIFSRPGSLCLGDAVGCQINLSNQDLSVLAATTTDLELDNAGQAILADNADFTDPNGPTLIDVTLIADTIDNDVGVATVGVEGIDNLTLTATGDIGAADALAVTANTVDVTDAGDVTLTDGVAGNTTYTIGSNTAVGAVSITETVSNLLITSIDATANAGLSTVDLEATAGTLDINGTIDADGAVDLTGGTGIDLGADITTDTDGVTFNDNVNLTADVAVDTSTGNGNIVFAALPTPVTVDGTQALDLMAGTGNISFAGAVGAGTALGAITINSAADVDFLSTVNAASVTQVAGTGTTTVGDANTDTMTLSGAFDFTGANLTLNALLDTGSTVDITNSGTFTTAADGDITADGAVTQDGAGTNSLAGDITTTADNIGFATAITLDGDVAMSTGVGAGNITYSSTIDSDDGTLTPRDLTLTADAGNITFVGAVGNTEALDALLINSAADVAFQGTVDATSVTQSAGTGTTTVGNDNTDTMTLSGAFDFTGTNLTLNALLDTGTTVDITNGGTFTTVADGDITADGAVTQDGAGSNSLAGDITTTADNISFATAVTLDADVAMSTGAGAGNITYSSTVDSDGTARDLTLTADAGNITFVGAVGNTDVLDALLINSAADVAFQGTVDATSVTQSAGTGTTTVGNDNTDTMTLSGAFDFTGANLTLNALLDTGTTVDITNSGTFTTAADGDITADGAVTQDGTGSNSLAGDITTTADNISFATAVTLTGAVAMDTDAGAGDITFSSTVDGTTDNTEDLTLTAGTGDIDFVDAVGFTIDLGDVTINSATNVDLQSTFNAASFTQVAGTGTTTVGGALTTNVGDVDITTNQIVQNAAIASAGEVRLEATEAVGLGIDLNTGILQANGRLIHLISANGVDQDATTHGGLDATDLLLEGAGDFTLVTDPGNNNTIDNVATVGTVAGVVSFENDQALAIDAVDDAAAATNNGAFAETLLVTTSAGDLTVNQAADATTGNLLLESQAGNLAINNTVDAAVDASLLAFLAITQGAAGDVTVGGDLDVEAQGGNITMTNGAVTTVTGDVRYLASAGVALASVSGDNVRIEATAAAITDAGDPDVDVTGNNVQLVAGTDIGTSANALEVNAGTLAVDAGNSAFVGEADSAIIGSVAAFTVNRVAIDNTSAAQAGALLEGVTVGDNAVVRATNDLTVSNAVSATAGNVLLQANTGDLTVNSTVDATAGNVSLAAAGTVSQGANGDVTAGVDIDVIGNAITMDDDALSDAANHISYVATGNITIGSLDAVDVYVGAGGDIIDGGEAAVDVIATTAQLVAGGSVGQAAGGANNGPLETTVTTLAGDALAGNVYISETDDLVIGLVPGITVNRVGSDAVVVPQGGSPESGFTAANFLKIEAGGAITVDEAVLATGNDLLLDAQGGNLALNAAVTATAGNASLLASAAITQGAAGDVTAGGTLDVNAQGGAITMTDDAQSTATGNVRYLATGDISVASISGANVRVESGGSIIDNGDTHTDIIGGGVQLVAATNIGEPDGTNNGLMDVEATTLSASAGAGDIFIDEVVDALTVGSVAAIDVLRVNINSTTSNQAGVVLAGATAASDAVIRTTTGLTIDNAVDATAGNLLLQAQNGNLAVNAAVSAGQDATLLTTTSGNITQGVNGDITAGETLYVNSVGNIVMSDGAVSNATGNIAYIGTDVTLGSLSGADVFVTATGDIIDGGETDVDVIATNAQLFAAGDIGEPDTTNNGPIDTTVTTIATQSGGNTYLSETDGLVVGSVAAINVDGVQATALTNPVAGILLSGGSAGNNYKVEAGGAITVDEAISATEGDVLLDATGALALNNTVTATTAAAAGNISLLATGTITQAATGDVSADGTLDVDAGDDILMTDGAVSVAAGNVNYEAFDAITVASVQGANVRLDAGSSITDSGDTNIDVIGGTVQLVAGSGAIGEPDGTNNGLLDVEATTLAAAAGTDIFIDEVTDDLTVGSVAAIDVLRVNIDSTTTTQTGVVLAGVTAASDAVIRTTTGLTIDNAVDATAGNLLLQAQNGNLAVNAAVSAGQDATLLTTTSGNITQGVNGDITAGETLYVNSVGNIVMSDGAVSNATGNIAYIGTDVTLGSLSGADVFVTATGDIIDGGETDVDVIATNAQLFAAGDIGEPDTTNNGPIDTTVTTIATQSGGNTYLSETDGLVVGSVAAINVDGVQATALTNPVAGILLSGGSAGNNYKVEAGGAITVDEAISATEGDVLLDATGALALNNTVTATTAAAAGNISLLATGTITQAATGDVSADGTLDVDAGDDILMTDGAVSVAAGNVNYEAFDAITVASVQGANVRLDAGSSITDSGDTNIDVIGGTVQLVAGSGAIGEPDGTNNGLLDVEATTLSAAAGTDIFIDEVTDALTVGSVAGIDVERVNINSTTTTQTGVVLAGATAGSDLVIRATDGLIIDNAVDAVAGQLFLQAQNGDLAVNAAVDAANDATLLASANVTQSVTGDITVGGTLDVEAQGGDITMADSGADSAVSTATGNIRYLATGDIRVGSLSTGADVLLETTAGSIIDNGETAVDVIAANTQLVANGSIGEISGTNNGPLETTVTVLAAEATNGNVYIFESDNLEIGTVAAIDVERVAVDNTTATQAGTQRDGIQAQLEVDVESDGLLITQEVRSVAGNILLTARNGVIDQTGATALAPDLNQVIALAGNIEMDATNGNILLQRVSADGNTVTLTTTDQILNNNLDALDAGLAGQVNVIADTLIASADDTIGLTAAGQFTDPSNEQRLITEVENDIQVFLAQAGTVGIDNTSTDGSVDVVFNLPLADVSNGSSVWVRTSEAMRALGLEFATESNSVEFNGNLQLLAVEGDLTLNEDQTPDANDVNLVAEWMRLSAPRGAFLNGDGSRFLNVGDGLVLTADDLVIVTGGDLGVEAIVDRADITGTGLYQVAPGGTPGTGGENADLDIQLSKRDITVVDDPILFETIVITRPASDGIPSWITDLDTYFTAGWDENNFGLFSTGTVNAISLRQDDTVNVTHDGSIRFVTNAEAGELSLPADLSLAVRAGQFNTTQYAGTIYVDPLVSVVAGNQGTPNTGTVAVFGNVLVDGFVLSLEDRSMELQGRGGDIIIDSDTSAAGRVLLSPGQGFDVIFTNQAEFRVTQGVSAEGDLVILGARNVVMDPGTAIIADGSVLIGADNITGSVVEASGLNEVEGDIILYNVRADANDSGTGNIVIYTTGGRSGESYDFDYGNGLNTYQVTGSIILGRQDVVDDLLAELALDPNFLDDPLNVPAPALQAQSVKLFAADSILSGWAIDYASGDLKAGEEPLHIIAEQAAILDARGGVVGGTPFLGLGSERPPTEQPIRVDVGDLLAVGAGFHDRFGVSANLVGDAFRLVEIDRVPGLILFNEWTVGGALEESFISGTSIDAASYFDAACGVMGGPEYSCSMAGRYPTANAVYDANMVIGQPQPVSALWVRDGDGAAGDWNLILQPGEQVYFKRYEVSVGDTLWDIAEEYLGDPLRWQEIWWLTEDIDDPDLIEPGQEVKLEVQDIKRLQKLKEEEEAEAEAEAEAAVGEGTAL